MAVTCAPLTRADVTQRARDRAGLTLIEVIVVLLLLGLAAALAAPAFVARQADAESQLASVIRGARELAERRGEIVHLQVGASGVWQVEGAASPEAGVLARGRLDEFAAPPFTLVLAPIGTCDFDVRSAGAAGFGPRASPSPGDRVHAARADGGHRPYGCCRLDRVRSG